MQFKSQSPEVIFGHLLVGYFCLTDAIGIHCYSYEQIAVTIDQTRVLPHMEVS